MKLVAISIFAALLCVGAAQAQEQAAPKSAPKPIASSQAPEKPMDPNKTISLTLGELQLLLAKGEMDAKFAAVIAKINTQLGASPK